ncbi:RNA-binding domain-containing protein [Phaeodactylibacter sp.]|jgi:CRP-like cAMP-binding protein|uniref:RNA-binding domain-containing protein n=1 Tax=Phaeodactylibacter sp. TaxID=1940289 RepID=UPI0025D1A0AC|nr:RNA-binding domain-containing protein [Phaeodactylibacter sp.]MCI4648595.1 putative DNA binding domain-containing protein [Phaeodactylibacter sp.]MCI5089890.1 putative DNA binding domain-containing protein [Phaeodactylibacter sp.]
MNEDIFKTLRDCKELVNLEDAEIKQLAGVAKLVDYEAGHEVFSIEQKGESFYIVHYGRLILYLSRKEPKSYTKGQLFGEIAIFNKTSRLGTIRATEPSKLIVFDKSKVFDDNKIPEQLKLKLSWALTQKIITYLVADESANSKRIIDKGESDMVEFKESIDKYHRDKIIQTLSAFMNLNGGTVFCGVDDEGKIIGLDATTSDIDNFKRSITSAVQRNLGSFFATQLSFDIEKIDDHMIFRIDTPPAKSPVFYRDVDKKGNEQEVFYIRTGSANIKIKKSSEIIKYIEDRYRFAGQ